MNNPMKPKRQRPEPYLIIIWDKACNSFYPMTATARSEREAKILGWKATLKEELCDEEDYSEDGGKAGFVPVLAFTRAELEQLLAPQPDSMQPDLPQT